MKFNYKKTYYYFDFLLKKIFPRSLYHVSAHDLTHEYWIARKNGKKQCRYYFIVDYFRKHHSGRTGKIRHHLYYGLATIEKNIDINPITIDPINMEIRPVVFFDEKLPDVYYKGLTKREKFILKKYFEENYFEREIGEMLGMTESNVSVILKTIKKKIKRLVREA